jgi:hypothetical protein
MHTFVGKPCGSLAMFPVVMTSLEQVVLSPALTRLSITLLPLDYARSYYKIAVIKLFASLSASSTLYIQHDNNLFKTCQQLAKNAQCEHILWTNCAIFARGCTTVQIDWILNQIRDTVLRFKARICST